MEILAISRELADFTIEKHGQERHRDRLRGAERSLGESVGQWQLDLAVTGSSGRSVGARSVNGVEFVVARNPDEGSSLPFLVKLPLGTGAVVLKVRDTWPRTAKIYCHRCDEWPDDTDLEVIERVPVTSCVRRGVAIDLVLDRGRENRSQFVFTKARGRDVVSGSRLGPASRRVRTCRCRPLVPATTSWRSWSTLGRYAWKFAQQQAVTVKRALSVGDYAVEADGTSENRSRIWCRRS